MNVLNRISWVFLGLVLASGCGPKGERDDGEIEELGGAGSSGGFGFGGAVTVPSWSSGGKTVKVSEVTDATGGQSYSTESGTGGFGGIATEPTSNIGGATNGGATNGGATNCGATNGGATNGGATNGGATNGGATNGGATNGDSEAALPLPVTSGGFIELEPVSYDYATGTTLGQNSSAVTSSAKLFYSFVPATENPRSATVYVFFNGGPSSATSGVLRAFGTGPTTLLESMTTAAPVENAASWATLGNLLYIDARQAGFSFSELDNVTDAALRDAEFTLHNYNVYADAADFVRVLLRFLHSEPALRNNPIVIVGESYGGIRASLMLSYLLNAPRLTTGKWYYTDEALAEEIGDHYAAVFPGEIQANVIGAVAARQFGRQVLIQPALAYFAQSKINRCSSEFGYVSSVTALGLPCPPTARDEYHAGRVKGWADSLVSLATNTLTQPSTFTTLMGVPAESISELKATGRAGAFRVGTLDANAMSWLGASSSPWATAYGALPEYDRYYVARNDDARLVIDFNYPSAVATLAFLENLLVVDTFITRAMLDGVIVADAVPSTLFYFGSTLMSTAGLSAIELDLAARDGVPRPGWFTVKYTGESIDGAKAGDVRVVRFPTYPDSGHMVTVTRPNEFRQDVADFVARTSK